MTAGRNIAALLSPLLRSMDLQAPSSRSIQNYVFVASGNCRKLGSYSIGRIIVRNAEWSISLMISDDPSDEDAQRRGVVGIAYDVPVRLGLLAWMIYPSLL